MVPAQVPRFNAMGGWADADQMGAPRYGAAPRPD
jgi:hypothetical protein